MKSTFTAKSLVPILGEKLEVSQSTALVIDRALAEANLRRKGKGRNWPDMLRSEAIIFLLACMVVRKPTQAADDVKPWLSTTCEIQTPDKPDPFDINEWRDDEGYQQQLKLLARAREHLPAGEESVTLVDWLLVVCALIESGDIRADDASLEIKLSHGQATVEFSTKARDPISQVFRIESTDSRRQPSATAIVTTSTISGATLLEVVRRTEGALLHRDSVHARQKG